MKRNILFLYLPFLITVLLSDPSVIIASNRPQDKFTPGRSASGFIENKGQIIDQDKHLNPAVLYLLHTPGMNVQLRKGGFSYDLYRISNIDQRNLNNDLKERDEADPRHALRVTRYEFHRIDLDLISANPHPAIETSAPSSGYLNYYTDQTPVEGVTGVRSFEWVTYKNIYPGIDLQFITDKNGQFEYNFVLQPGADINSIKLRVNGPQRIKSFREGLRCETSIGEVDEMIPVCYYEMNDAKVPVKGRFKKTGEHLYGFSMDQVIPSGAVLLIDPIPTRRWGTYFGGPSSDHISNGGSNGIAIDINRNIFLAGYTNSASNIATAGAYQTVLLGWENGFLSKFSTNGQILWSTYYGPSRTEGITCTVDKNGDIFFAGFTTATSNIATPGAFQTVLVDTVDAFLAKFNTAGQRLWCTYYGGHERPPWITGTDEFSSCVTDTSGNVYCAGATTSPDNIATPGAVQTVYGGNYDGMLVKFTGDGQRLWGTYYGGTNAEENADCAITKSGNIYLSGATNSPNNIATPGSFMPVYNGQVKGFLVCFDLNGQRQWGTYFGGENQDQTYGCLADTGSNVYVHGVTLSTMNIATPGAFQPTFSGTNMNGYLEKFSKTGQRLWGTYMGQCWADAGCVDDSGFVFITGGGASQGSIQNLILATPNAYQVTSRGYDDAFLEKFTGDGQRIWGTFYGGMDGEGGYGCVTDLFDNIYLTGITDSYNNLDPNTNPCTRNPLANQLASPGAYQTEFAGPDDVFLVKFADCYSPDTAAQIYGPLSVCQNTSGINYSIDPLVTVIDYHWCVTGAITITAGQGTTFITVDVETQTGIDSISVYGINACDTGFPKIIKVHVMPRPVPVITGADTVCMGSTYQYTTKGGKSNYLWTKSAGGTITIGGTTADSSCSVHWNLPGAQWIRVSYIDTNGCQALVPTQLNVWDTGSVVNVGISESANLVCAGTSVTFTATPTNGGATPAYLWKVNGVPSGSNSPLFTYTPLNGDAVSCILTSSNTLCVGNNPATSNIITMIVYPNLPVSVTVDASLIIVCVGTPVHFTATPTNGGLTPHYQWKVNGGNVGFDSTVYTYIPANGDMVSVILNSSEGCTTNNPASSIQYPASVSNNLPVSVTVSASQNPSCAGTTVHFTAAPIHGGTTPHYSWKVNGGSVGFDSTVYSYVPVNGDMVSVILTSSEVCTTNNPASSIQYPVSVSNNLPVGVSITASQNPFCPGASVTFSATPTNGGGNPAYLWKVNGATVTGSTSSYAYNPVTGDSVRCIMQSNLPCVTGNPASSSKIIMSGTLAPIVSFTPCFDTITTLNAKPIKLKGGIPLGGTYSGPGVNSITGVFTPSLAGLGTKTISYSYTNVSLCTSISHLSIVISPSSFVNCGNNLTDIRDGKIYSTVQIGTQCWFAEDLNYGSEIPFTQNQRDNCSAEKYHNPASSIPAYPAGRQHPASVYQWDELMQYVDSPAEQGLCPPGWHVPTENDWLILFSNYTNNAMAGSPLKYSGYSGFNALLQGANHLNRQWDYPGFATFYWSSTSHGPIKAWAHGMNDPDPSVSSYPAVRTNAFSVRCIKD